MSFSQVELRGLEGPQRIPGAVHVKLHGLSDTLRTTGWVRIEK